MPHVFPIPANTLTALSESTYACYGRDNSLMAITPNEGIALLLCGLGDILSPKAPPEAVKGTLALIADYLNARSEMTNQVWFVDGGNRLDYHDTAMQQSTQWCSECGYHNRGGFKVDRCKQCGTMFNE